jgi:hypothetical protein
MIKPMESATNFCIAIGSHIKSIKRIHYLVECLQSLLKQTIVIPIYLSISFENKEIEAAFKKELNGLSREGLNIFIRDKKTPQMRHFKMLLENLGGLPEWVMFCDDDDTYDLSRVENLVKSIHLIKQQVSSSEKIFAGLYESHCEKDHREHRHEYWCYCVNKHILERFYNTLKDHDDIVDHKCCDVLFGEYMRRLGPNYFFGRLDMRLYNYRVNENQDSVTGVIQSKQGFYTRKTQHPLIGDPTLPDYILDWNDYLHENLEVYLHDVFLRTLVGCDMQYILQAEFRSDYDLMPYVDECHSNKMRELHEYLRTVCAKLYDIPL